jgi:hypothetical protein
MTHYASVCCQAYHNAQCEECRVKRYFALAKELRRIEDLQDAENKGVVENVQLINQAEKIEAEMELLLEEKE